MFICRNAFEQFFDTVDEIDRFDRAKFLRIALFDEARYGKLCSDITYKIHDPSGFLDCYLMQINAGGKYSGLFNTINRMLR